MIGDEVHGPLSPNQVPTLLETYLAKAAEDLVGEAATQDR
jgi:hypothetical protein